jgi:hypothetical protein
MSCWNHGVYTNTADGAAITGNTFNRCQIPVACSGSYNSVTGNTMYTSVAVVGDQRDLTGIQIRDSRGSVVTGIPALFARAFIWAVVICVTPFAFLYVLNMRHA